MTTRGDHRARIFDDDTGRVVFLRRYETVIERHGWVPLTYCLMSNHVHLVVETPRCTLGEGARDLFSDYASRRNRHLGETGHIFQGRYDSRLVSSDEYLAQLLRYVALNPVTAGLCGSPEEWRWSGHSTLLAGVDGAFAQSQRVQGLLEVWGGRPAARYARLFDETNPLAQRYGAADPSTWRPPLTEVLEGADGLAAARSLGYRLREIADHLGVHESTVSRMCKKGV